MAVPTEPDLLVRGGAVLTLDAAGRRVSALAASGGRITALGDDREISALAGPRTRILELEGRTAIPGFVESHNHPVFFGFALAAPVDAGSPPNDGIPDIIERLAVAVRDAPAREWVRGFRYDHTLLAERRHPTRHDMDPVAPRHPVLLTHVTGHFCTVNSAALALLGITAATPDPPGGRIERDASGEPTGVLVETAAFLVNSQLPSPDEETLEHALRLADREFLTHGITTVHDTGTGLFGSTVELGIYQRLSASGELRTRVRGYLAQQAFAREDGSLPTPAELAVSGDEERFRVAGVKIIADGSLQGGTGCLAEGYHQHPDEHGLMLQSPGQLAEMITRVDAAGWQAAVHGNGDAAIEAIIRAYRNVDSAARRHRIEHCQTVREDQLDRMAEQGVLASFFIKHVYYWGDGHRDLWLGPERARRISPLVSAHRRGIVYGLHSDTPVTPVPPLEGVWCAVARRTRDGHVLGPEQAVDVERALRAYTVDAAYLAGEESETGTLEVGKLADLAVLSGDPTAVPTEDLRTLRVEATVVGGEIAWSANGEPGPAL